MTKFIKSYIKEFTVHFPENDLSIEEWVESIARTCWKSEDKIKIGSAKKLLLNLIKNDHLSMFEHVIATARIITDRAIMAELTRHRLASFAVESSRYINYKNKDFCFIIQPEIINKENQQIWEEAVKASEEAYCKLVNNGVHKQIARSVLPLATKTEMVMTANLREWMTIIKLRTSDAAHPIIRELTQEILEILYKKMTIIFADLYEKIKID